MSLHAGFMAFVLFAQGLGGVAATADPKVGTLTDPIGGVVVRVAGEPRGEPLVEQRDLLPGDRVEVDLRVAGAVTLDLAQGGKLVLGPGAQLAVSTERVLTWLAGPVCQVKKGEQASGVLLPDGASAAFGGDGCGQIDDQGEWTASNGVPLWLTEYRKGTSMRSLGALTATVDGKEIPLRLVRHAVTVEIRDGLALTTVENVFRNGTSYELEGVFEFPLPQDASVSEFGVWYGDRLVMADVAEKSRARQVYQTLMMEKKAPGLLEVAEGNRFRTRIHPIPAMGEKRVRISYTQVLGWKGNGWLYSYPLVSDMTQTAGLEELKLHVVVATQRTIKEVVSLHHAAAIEKAGGAARVEYTAQDVVPQHDFQVAIQVEEQPGKLVWMPHVQGKDGYFLATYVMQTANQADPKANTNLEFVFWLDSSGSMDPAARKVQKETVLAYLQGLGADDRFRVALCDGGCVWFSPEAKAVDAKVRGDVAVFLDQRISLGWTDLAASLAEVTKGATAQTRVIYLGDGLETRSLPDPLATAEKLEKQLANFPGRLSVVAVGRAADQVVLKRLASAGKGILVDGTAEVTSAVVVSRLLKGLNSGAAPKVELAGQGIKLGAVVTGVDTQSSSQTAVVWVGRFDPSSQSAEATLQVLVDGQKVAQGLAPSAPEGTDNSMVMRFWARRYIDELLAGKDAGTKKAEVIGLSEEYGVLSPFTSFIVIDSDVERARFGVKRLVRMGNGERFFAEGRDQAEQDLARVAMVAGQRWRLGMKGRLAARYVRPDLASVPMPGAGSTWNERGEELTRTASTTLDAGIVGWGAGGGRMALGSKGYAGDDYRGAEGENGIMGGERSYDKDAEYDGKEVSDNSKRESDRAVKADAAEEVFLPPQELTLAETPAAAEPAPDMPKMRNQESSGRDGFGGMDELMEGDFGGVSTGAMEQQAFYKVPYGGPAKQTAGKAAGVARVVPGVGYLGVQEEPWWMNEIVPRPGVTAPVVEPLQDPKEWSAEALQLSKSVARLAWLRQQPGMRVTEKATYFTAGSKAPYSREEKLSVVTPGRWSITRISTNAGATTTWFEKGKKGLLNESFGAARVWDAGADDGLGSEYQNSNYLFREPHLYFYGYDVKVIRKEGLVVLELRPQAPSKVDSLDQIEIDPAKGLAVKMRSYRAGELVSTTEVQKFAQVGGVWLPALLQSSDAKGRVTYQHEWQWTAFEATAAESEFSALKASLERAVVFEAPAPGVATAKEKMAAGKAGNADLLVLVAAECNLGRFDKALEQLEQLAKANPNKVLNQWLRLALLGLARKHTEIEALVVKLARLWTDFPLPGSAYVATYLHRQAQQFLRGEPLIRFVDSLEPLFQPAVAPERGGAQWGELRAQALDTANRRDEGLLLRLELASKYPDDLGVQQGLISYSMYDGDPEELLERLEQLEKRFGSDPNATEWIQSYRLDLFLRTWDGDALVKAAKVWSDQPQLSYSSAHQRYLAALESAMRPEEARKVAQGWIEEALKAKGKLDETASGRLNAGLNYASGYGYSAYTGRMVPELAELVADVAYRAVTEPEWAEYLYTLQSHEQFRFTPAGKKLRERLKALVQTADFSKPEKFYLAWSLMVNLGPATPAEAAPVMKALRQEWSKPGALAEPTKRYWLASMVEAVGASKEFRTDGLDFLRAVAAAVEPKEKAGARLALFQALVTGEVGTKNLEEASLLLAGLGQDLPSAEYEEILMAGVDQLAASWNSFLYREKYKALPSTQNRMERSKAAAMLATEVRSQTAEEMARLVAQPGSFGTLARMKELALRVSLGQSLDAAATESMAWLNQWLQKGAALQEWEMRRLVRASDLAAATAVAKKDTEFLDKVSLAFEQAAKLGKSADERLAWQLERVSLWLATEGNEALLAYVGQRMKDGPTGVAWDVVMAALYAERGRVVEAHRMLEAAAERDPLDGYALALLRDLRTALPKETKQGSDKVKESALAAAEWELSQQVQIAINKARNQGSEPRLGNDVIEKIRALMSKSTYPQNYIHLVSQAFSLTLDGRVLEALFDAFPGMTSEQVSSLLLSFSYTLQNLSSESAVKVILEQVSKAQKKATEQRLLRQLALVKLMVTKTAIAVGGTGKAHEEQASGALADVVRGVADPDEAFATIQAFYSMGSLGAVNLDAARSAAAVVLLGVMPKGTSRRLDTAVMVANLMSMNRGEALRAFELMRTELEMRLKTSEGRLAQQEWNALDSLITHAVTASVVPKAEEYVRGLFKAAPKRQHAPLQARLTRLCSAAVASSIVLPWGGGTTLVAKCLDAALEQVPGATQDGIRELAVANCELLRSAHYAGVNVGTLTRENNRRLESKYLPLAGPHWAQIVGTSGDTVRDVFSPKEAVAYVLALLDKAPRFQQYVGATPFDELEYRFVEWMRDVPVLGDLEKPFLEMVVGVLRQDLLAGQGRTRQLYTLSNDLPYTKLFAPRLAAEATKIGETMLACPRCIGQVAQYLEFSLERGNDAALLLAKAHAFSPLDPSSLRYLVDLWLRLNKPENAVPLAAELVTRSPDDLSARLIWMEATAKAKKGADAARILAETEQKWRKSAWWSASVAGEIGLSATRAGLYVQAQPLLSEAISARQATGGLIGRDSLMAQYLVARSEVLLALKKYRPALDDALTGMLAAGPGSSLEVQGRSAARLVLEKVPSLKQFIAEQEKLEAESGQVVALLHVLAAQVLSDKAETAEAIRHYRIAVETNPYDAKLLTEFLEYVRGHGSKQALVEEAASVAKRITLPASVSALLATAWFELGNTEQALRALTHGVELESDQAAVRFGLANSLKPQKREEDYLGQLEAAYKLAPKDGTILVAYGAALAGAHREAEAVSLFQKALGEKWLPETIKAQVNFWLKNLKK